MTENPARALSRRSALISGTAAATGLLIGSGPAATAAAAAAAPVDIIPRSAWGAAPPAKPITDPWSPWLGGVAIHHHGNSYPWPWDSYYMENHEDCFGQVREVQQARMDDGYDDIPYNYLVCHHGGIFEGRGPDVRSAANDKETPGANQNYFAIMGMAETNDTPTQAMVTSIRELIAHLRQHEQAGPRILGHRDLDPGTECPGNLYPNVGNGSLDPGPMPDPHPSLTIQPRSQWGARPARAAERVEPSARTGFTVHYSAGPPTQTPRQIQNYHMDSNGWDDIGYNFLVDTAGRIYEGRGWYVLGAHAAPHNTTHIGVCFIGQDGQATALTAAAIRALYHRANAITGKTLAQTWHGGLPGQSTQCPGSALRAWVQDGMQGDDLPITDGSGDSHGGMTSVRTVAAQQSAVNGLGHSPPLTVDGIWGPLTDAGVRWLQTRVGVAADGLWGPATEAAYNAYLDEGARLAVDGVFGPATITATQRAIGVTADGVWGPASIRGLQRHLNTWSDAGLTVDGAMGPGTVSALQRHLNRMVSAGLAVDGAWGPATIRALQHALNLARL